MMISFLREVNKFARPVRQSLTINIEGNLKIWSHVFANVATKMSACNYLCSHM